MNEGRVKNKYAIRGNKHTDEDHCKVQVDLMSPTYSFWPWNVMKQNGWQNGWIVVILDRSLN